MKYLFVGFTIVGLAFSSSARTWTSSDGKTVEADLVRVHDGKAYLRPDGRTKLYPFEISKLSETDQSFIEAYNKEIEQRLEEQRLEARSVRWHTDFDDAVAEAEETGFPILFLYTAPSWCGWCVKLEANVLDQPEFKQYAKRNLVFYIADFSDSHDGDRWKKKNSDLLKKYPMKGFPTSYIIAPDGRKLGKIGGGGDTMDEFIGKIENLKKKM